MTATAIGPIGWNLKAGEDFYRDYTLRTLVATDDDMDGPQTVLDADGLPQWGDTWLFGNDNDPWVICHPQANVTPVVDHEPNKWWIVEQLFSNRPLKRCLSSIFQNPLSEPPKITGSFTRYTAEANYDNNGNPIISSSYEYIEGLTQDLNRPSVVIEQNYSSSTLPNFAPMVCSINDSPLWGLPTGTIMLVNVVWARLLMPFNTCQWYYNLRLEFEVHYEGFTYSQANNTGVEDIGYNVLGGSWSTASPPVWTPKSYSKTVPTNFVRALDPQGNPFAKPVPLDGNGNFNQTNTPVFLPDFTIPQYANFYALNIPSSL